MEPTAFEQAILLAMAFLAVAVLSLVLSIILGRRRARRDSVIAKLPTKPVPSRNSIETNFGRF